MTKHDYDAEENRRHDQWIIEEAENSRMKKRIIKLEAEVERLNGRLEKPTEEGWKRSLKKMQTSFYAKGRQDAAKRCAEIAGNSYQTHDVTYDAAKDVEALINKEFGIEGRSE